MSAVNRPLSSSMDLDKHALGLTFKNSLREWYARQKQRQASSPEGSAASSARGAGVVRSRRPIR
jgi:chromosome condensin MukBEF MukE localization factor